MPAANPDDQTRPLEWKEWLLALQADLARRETALQAERVKLEAELRALGIDADDPIQVVVDSLSADERAALIAEAGMSPTGGAQAAAATPAAARRLARRQFL